MIKSLSIAPQSLITFKKKKKNISLSLVLGENNCSAITQDARKQFLWKHGGRFFQNTMRELQDPSRTVHDFSCHCLSPIYCSVFLTCSQPITILQIYTGSRWKQDSRDYCCSLTNSTPLFQCSFYSPRITRRFYFLPLVSPREIILPYFPQSSNVTVQKSNCFSGSHQ